MLTHDEALAIMRGSNDTAKDMLWGAMNTAQTDEFGRHYLCYWIGNNIEENETTTELSMGYVLQVRGLKGVTWGITFEPAIGSLDYNSASWGARPVLTVKTSDVSPVN